mmetsp:Transcript_11908/g.39168  ORF Transcript_11908/g.39168 Transcript_11908/m.39168 type:complete len:253 (+) Transcript_11908:1820-2578(+)
MTDSCSSSSGGLKATSGGLASSTIFDASSPRFLRCSRVNDPSCNPGRDDRLRASFEVLNHSCTSSNFDADPRRLLNSAGSDPVRRRLFAGAEVVSAAIVAWKLPLAVLLFKLESASVDSRSCNVKVRWLDVRGNEGSSFSPAAADAPKASAKRCLLLSDELPQSSPKASSSSGPPARMRVQRVTAFSMRESNLATSGWSVDKHLCISKISVTCQRHNLLNGTGSSAMQRSAVRNKRVRVSGGSSSSASLYGD